MNQLKVASILCLMLLLGCEKYEGMVPFIEYKIFAGEHSTEHSLSEIEHEWISYDVIFDESASYYTLDPNNQADINKLFGFADCNSNHEENSIRFGWRWFNERLEILAYQHFDGEITWEYIGSVELNVPYRYSIYLFDDRYELEVVDISNMNTIMTRSSKVCNKGVYYQLWPYFGGDETAPQDISIFMRQRYDIPEYKR